MIKERINYARTSFYKAKKPGGVATLAPALRTSLPAGKTPRKDCVAAISQKVESSNSTFAIPLQAQIDERVALTLQQLINHLTICTLLPSVLNTDVNLIWAISRALTLV